MYRSCIRLKGPLSTGFCFAGNGREMLQRGEILRMHACVSSAAFISITSTSYRFCQPMPHVSLERGTGMVAGGPHPQWYPSNPAKGLAEPTCAANPAHTPSPLDACTQAVYLRQDTQSSMCHLHQGALADIGPDQARQLRRTNARVPVPIRPLLQWFAPAAGTCTDQRNTGERQSGDAPCGKAMS